MRPEFNVTSLFDQAVQTFGEAMKAGVKAQQEVAKWWAGAFDQAASVGDWQKRSAALVNEAIPAAQKNTEEWLRVLEANYKRSMDLLKRAFDSNAAPTAGEPAKDVQARTRELWEASLGVIHDNTQAMAETNLKVMDLWANVLKKNFNGNGGAGAYKATPEAVGVK